MENELFENEEEELEEELEEGWDDYYEDAMVIVIDGNEYEVDNIKWEGSLSIIRLGRNLHYYVFDDDYDDVGRTVCRRYWEEMASSDPREFQEIVGIENILSSWMCGNTFNDWLDEAEREWESVLGYGEDMIYIKIQEQRQPWFENLCNELGFEPTVVLRR